MGFNLNCFRNLFGGCCSVGKATEGGVDWVHVGEDALQQAKPYQLYNIGEVERPQEVDINDAFHTCEKECAHGMKPYEVPEEAIYEDGNVKALLIGINYYGSSAELSGCVNDVKQELATFQQTGFPVDEMAILVDDEDFPNLTAFPTRANIIKYMAWLVKDAEEGDVLFMHYSGHGTQTRSYDGYEKYDQVICPVDFERAGCILDNDIFAILGRRLPKGVRLTVLFDCCHSGTMMDLPYIYGYNSLHFTSSTEAHMQQIRRDNFSLGDILMISGCEDEQTSADVGNTAKMGNGTKGAGGAGTQCLTYILLNTKNLTFYDVMVKTRKMLIKKKFTQVPQLSCSKPLDMDSKFSMMRPLELDQSLLHTLPSVCI